MRLHRAWAVAAATFLVLLSAAAFRSSYGLMLVPIESDLGWTRSATSLAVSVNLVFYGVTAPFAAALMERVGVRRVAVAALLLIAAGTGLMINSSRAILYAGKDEQYAAAARRVAEETRDLINRFR